MSTNKQNRPQPLDMLGRSGVVPLTEALNKLHSSLEHCPPTLPESVDLTEGLDRILTTPIQASEDLPPQPRSTMDGFAVRAADTFGASETMPVYLAVSGEVAMGETVNQGPGEQECFRIATGGFLPPEVDSVIMLEHTVTIDEKMIEVTKAISPGGNIIATGDDVRRGSVLLESGIRLRPQELGLLAGLGETKITVHKTVQIGIFSTGDEIVPHDHFPPPGKIRDMNGINLCALARKHGATVKYYGIVADREEEFESTMNRALSKNDMVLFSGSSSVGVRDMGERIINRLTKPGIIVHGVAIKPGKPVIIAFADHKPLFGLPGHPVSSAVAFDLFVRPTILHLSGLKQRNFTDRATIRATLRRNLNSAPGRVDFVRVRLEESDTSPGMDAFPVLGKSGAISTMVRADGYIVIEESSQGLYEGEEVQVHTF
ncbi:MAG: molybdopterin molybdotransferase MoeA [Desulfobulbaceae bacterium]|nr:molybdopterin molybdotransferase MoeA [Desulfobulbaceae bacterium]